MNSRSAALAKIIILIAALLPLIANAQTPSNSSVITAKQDYVTSHPEFNRVLVDTDRVRVFEYILEAGEKEGWHAHPDMVLYVVEGGTIRAEFAKGEALEFIEVPGEAKYLDAGAKHTAENIGQKRIVLLITEFK